MPELDNIRSILTTEDDKLKRLKIEEAEVLIAEFPTLKEHLEDGWLRKSFKVTCQLGAFELSLHSIFSI